MNKTPGLLLTLLAFALLGASLAQAIPNPLYYYNFTSDDPEYIVEINNLANLTIYGGSSDTNQPLRGNNWLVASGEAFDDASETIQMTYDGKTMCTWYWLQYTNVSGQAARLFQLGNSTHKFEVQIGSNQLNMYYFPDSTVPMQSSYTYNDTWKHLCFVFDYTVGTHQLYIDATLVNTSYNTLIGGFPETTDWLAYFANNDGGAGDARYDEMAIFNTTLTAQDVSDLYNAGAGRFYEGGAWTPTLGGAQDPVIQTVGWNTTTGNTNMTLFLNSTLDWLFANVTDADNLSSEVTVKVHVTNPNSVVVENNSTMPNTYASMYELNTNILLNETGQWIFLFTADDAQAYETNVSVLNVTCTSNWVCNGYASCLTNDTRYCNSVTDLNFCGVSYGGDYTEFAPQACNYCTGAYSAPILGTCVAANQTIGYVYTNTCCATTSLPSDCTAPTNTTQYCGYTPNYSGDDLSNSLIDVLVTIIIIIGSFSAIIAIVLGVRFVRRK